MGTYSTGKMSAVNTKADTVDPADLRAFCARNKVQHVEIARLLGCSRSYVGQVCRGAKTASPQQLERIRDAAQKIIWRRDARCMTT